MPSAYLSSIINLAELLLLNYNNCSGAIYHYRRSLEVKPQHNTVAKISLLMLEGEQHLFQERPEAAITMLTELTMQFPEAQNLWLAHRRIAGDYDQLNRPEEAAHHYRSVISMRPTAGAWTGLGYSLLKLKQTDEARAAYSTAIRLNPGDRAALRGLQMIQQPEIVPDFRLEFR